MTLSPRLEALFNELLPDFPAWDVGYDHGQLGLYALASGQFPQVNFVDPVESLATTLRTKLNSRSYSEVRKNAMVYICPLAELPVSVYGSLVFAGVGAQTILTNLEALLKQSRLYAQRVILSPHRDAEKFLEKTQEWAPEFAKKYSDIETKKVLERGRVRFIYIFEPKSFQA